MKYSDFFWKHIDALCSDTSLAHSFGEKVWNHQQQEIDRLNAIIAEAFYAYKPVKEMHIRSLAEKYKDQIDPRVYDALMNWTVEITD